MKFSTYISAAALLAVASLTACQDDFEDVENRVFDTGALVPTNVLIDGRVDVSNVSFTVNMANPVDNEINVTYAPDFSKVEAYNAIYGTEAIALPEANFELVEPTAVFIGGAVESSAVQVRIKGLLELDRDLLYVLPLSVSNSPVPVLESQRTRYIVVRSAALVNVAANMRENSAALVNPDAASALDGLTQMTMQCIINVDEWGGSDVNIQSILGIEGQFLFRISDAGLPANQLQFVTPVGNISDASWQLSDKKWLRLSFTWDSTTGEGTLYVDGAKKNTMTNSCRQAINWGNSDFNIGKSYNDNRWLNGCISEVRIWNRCLSQAEIAEKLQAYDVPVDSEGLVAYWKFNEGSGSLIRDYANGNNVQCKNTPDWVECALPEE